MTRHILAVLVVALVLPATAHSQGKPDFSGTWTMDPSRSQAAVQNEPVSFNSSQSEWLETIAGDEQALKPLVDLLAQVCLRTITRS